MVVDFPFAHSPQQIEDAVCNALNGTKSWKDVWTMIEHQVGPCSASDADKVALLQRFYEAALAAGHELKRRLLLTGLISISRQKVLESGWSNILWERLVELEPPEVMFMERLWRQGTFASKHPDDVELATRLERKGLVVRLSEDGWSLQGAAERLMECLFLQR